MLLLVIPCVLGCAAPRTPPPAPITEVDVYRDMARFWLLAAHEHSVLVGAGAGVIVSDGAATVDVAYRRPTLGSLWDLLPTTAGIGLWARNDAPHVDVAGSLGWTLVLGLFGGPYITANAIGATGERGTRLGFDAGLGYELRTSKRWSLAADVRLVGLWPLDHAMDESPWGVRTSLFVRRFVGDLP